MHEPVMIAADVCKRRPLTSEEMFDSLCSNIPEDTHHDLGNLYKKEVWLAPLPPREKPTKENT